MSQLSSLVITVIGPDRPGLVDAVADCVASQGGNWLESRMSHLGGQFAGILRVEVEYGEREGLVQALRALGQGELELIVHPEENIAPVAAGTAARIELVGQDRPGILRRVSQVLATNRINVEELESERVSAPMEGGTLFQARLQVLVPDGLPIDQLRAELEQIASDLLVDLTLRTGSA